MFTDGTVENFWFNHNSECWRIQRYTMVDFYLYLPTMKYVYRSAFGEWRGTMNPHPMFRMPKKDQIDVIKFECENDALIWLKEI
jgi:hypothetical protein